MIYPSIIGRAKYLDRHCRVKFMELLKTLTPRQASSILAREIQDFELKRAVVQKVILGIKAREECIRQIEEMSARDFRQGAGVTQEKVDAVSFIVSH
jgi:hypothetical protein